MNSGKRITLNADDLGLSPAVNQAICRLAAMGRIQSASFMSLGRLAADELAALRQTSADIGLHLDLTGLARQGSLRQVMARSWLRRWPPGALQALIARQLDAFEDQLDRPPAFVDGHQHVHQFPQVRQALLAEMQRRYGQRTALRSTRPLRLDAKSLAIYLLGGWRLDRQARHLPRNTRFGGAYPFANDAPRLQQRWQQWLAAAPPAGGLIMCHPALPDSSWQDEIKPARELEWHWLSSNAFARLWQQNACQPQSWADMAALRQGMPQHQKR